MYKEDVEHWHKNNNDAGMNKAHVTKNVSTSAMPKAFC